MKEILAVIMIVSIALSMFAVFTPKAIAGENVIFQDDFESYAVGTFPYAGGWEIVWNGAGDQYQVITDSYYSSPTKSLQLMGSYGWSVVVKKGFSSSSNLIGYEARLMASVGGGGSVAFCNIPIETWGRYYAMVGFGTDGFIWACSHGNEGYQQLQTYTPYTWYKIRVLIDRSARVYDVWIDDVLKGHAIPIADDPWEILSLQFQVGWVDNNGYFDDVKVFEIGAPPPTYDITINAYCNTESADVSVAIAKDGSSTGFSTPHTFTALTGTHTFAVPSTDSSGHPFASWDKGEKTTTITVTSGGTFTAYYQDGLKGISNVITITASLNTNTGFSLQQNFYLYTGKKDSQNNPEVYWCQNTVETGKVGEGIWSRASMWIWKCYFSGDDIQVGDTFDRCQWYYDFPNNLPKVGLPINFVSRISSNNLLMENDIGSWHSDKLVLTNNAYITSTYIKVSGWRIIAPNFVIVGPASGGEVIFTGGSGSVSCNVQTGDGLWRNALNLDVVWPQASTGETSKGLMWFISQGQSSAGFGYQAGAEDQGVFFGFDVNDQPTQAPAVESRGTPANTLTFAARCPVYLDLYDDSGRCVGYNGTSGAIDFGIENVMWISNQSMLVVNPEGAYCLEITGTDNGTYELETSWQDVTGASCTISDVNGTITENETQVYAIGNNADVALMGILPCKTVVGQGSIVKVNVIVADLGGPDATFNVTLYANETVIGTQSILNLSGWNSTNVCFSWDTHGFAKGNYTISAVADTVLGETYTSDNTFVDGLIKVSCVGDLNGDYVTDGQDYQLVKKAVPSSPGSPRWNPNADLNDDGVVDGQDFQTVKNNIGQSAP